MKHTNEFDVHGGHIGKVVETNCTTVRVEWHGTKSSILRYDVEDLEPLELIGMRNANGKKHPKFKATMEHYWYDTDAHELKRCCDPADLNT